MRRLRVSLRLIGVISAAVAATAVIASAPAVAGTVNIGPNQYFIGLVNAQAAQATVKVNCPGPISVGQKGYAIAGQTLAIEEIFPPSASAPGYTGDLAHSINAYVANPAGTTGQLLAVFTSYGSQEFPTNVLLPCTGGGIVTFDPNPASSNSRPYNVPVTFIPTCPSPICPAAVRTGSPR